jgi:hypothetical protein
MFLISDAVELLPTHTSLLDLEASGEKGEAQSIDLRGFVLGLETADPAQDKTIDPTTPKAHGFDGRTQPAITPRKPRETTENDAHQGAPTMNEKPRSERVLERNRRPQVRASSNS